MNDSKKISNLSRAKDLAFYRYAVLVVTIFAVVGIIFLTYVFFASAANNTSELKGDGVWQDVDESSIQARGERQIVPEKYRAVRLDEQTVREFLADAPLEFSEAAKTREAIFSLPLPDGTFSRFRIVESPIMHPELAAKFPEIKTYSGQGIDDASATLRFDLTPHGFHAIVLRSEGSVYIDPYAKGDTENYISYLKSDFRNDAKRMVCDFRNDSAATSRAEKDSFAPDAPNVSIGGTLRKYRLALAANYEYSLYHSGMTAPAIANKTLTMAAMVTTMNRVNAIYLRDFSVRMEFVANNDQIIFNTAASPYVNDDGTSMLATNIVTINTIIGAGNYDIGHVVSTGGGGVAFLGVVCGLQKAGGVTGSPAPVGDPFDIDYVAHEMGHQFGGNHTFNGSTGSCSGNESSDTAMEPGSGTTIQAYAGICGGQDLQRNSDDHFHVRSLEEMTTHITTEATCSIDTPDGNAVPTITAGLDYTIPRDTPFTLTAVGSDANGDSLTYNWEEYDTGAASAVGTDNDNGGIVRPIFRSYTSRVIPTRTFPSWQYILNNANVPPATYDCGRAAPCTTGEDLPSLTRQMRFQVTARDNRSSGGAINSDLTQVNVDAASGPFVVTAPNTNVTFNTGAITTVTWNVANTTAAPVNAASVNIRLSTDGGQTFSTLLKSNTPNDGTETVIIPNTVTTTARILVEAAQNIFFDVSDTNFTIAAGPTAAPADLGGRITDAYGRPLRGVRVRLSNADGTLDMTVLTNARGFYRFTEVPTGADYFLTPSRRGYGFNPEIRVLTHFGEESNLDFSGRYD